MGLVKRAKATEAQPAAEERALDAEAVARLLKSADADERRRAAKAAMDVPRGAALLAEAIAEERDPAVLDRISLSLAEILDEADADAVAKQLRCENAAARNMVIDLLAQRQELLIDRLPALMRDPEVDFRIMLVQVASGMRSKEALDRLSEALPDETDDNVCASILEALTENGEGAKALAAAEAAAERFADHPFLSFAAKLARDRLAGR